MKLPKSPTYYLMLESYLKAVAKGSLQVSHKESADSTSYEQIETIETFKIFQDISIIAQKFMDDLETAELKMVMKIVNDLKMNNALWYHKPKDSRDYKTIASLVKRDLLIKTEDSNIFVVNPEFIRRGTIASVLAQTMKHLSTMSKVDISLIHDLRYKKIEVIQYDRLHNN